MILLLINEYANYRRLIITTLTYVDKNRGSDQIPVNIEVDLYNLPCELLSMEMSKGLIEIKSAWAIQEESFKVKKVHI